MVLTVQLIGIIFGILMMYLTFLHLKRNEFTSKESLAWFGIWVVFILVSLLPTTLDFLVQDVLKLSRRLDFFIITGFMFILGIVYYMYGIIRETQKKVEQVVRNDALANPNKPKKQ